VTFRIGIGRRNGAKDAAEKKKSEATRLRSAEAARWTTDSRSSSDQENGNHNSKKYNKAEYKPLGTRLSKRPWASIADVFCGFANSNCDLRNFPKYAIDKNNRQNHKKVRFELYMSKM
jgi:hypothetical protein